MIRGTIGTTGLEIMLRGNQICGGVQQASGDVLLFLHADSVFPSGGPQRIRQVLAEYPKAVGGNFRLVFVEV
jgi:hypothetical protein